MVFSLFGRKGKPAPQKPGSGTLARGPDKPRISRATHEAQREAARRTAEKIDQIESEMMVPANDAKPRERDTDSAVTAPRAAPAEATVPARAPTDRTAVSPRALSSAGNASPAADPPSNASPTAALSPGAGKVVQLQPVKRGESQGISVLIGHTIDANAIDIFGSSLPALLEEAAILYANGQTEQAVSVLLQALEDPTTASLRPLAWMMLLDLYQATGDKSAFEETALAYAAQFEASAPGWDDAQAVASAAQTGRGSAAAYALPAHLDAAVAGLCARVARGTDRPAGVVIDCAMVGSAEPAGAAPLVALIEDFIASGHRLVVMQPAALSKAALAAIEGGRRDPSPACWMLALLALRLVGERQRFEDVAIEYCVTYELSPPSWEALPDWIRIDVSSGAGTPEPRSLDSRSAAFSFDGDVVGRMQSELTGLRAYASERGDVVIDCRRLRRIDFVASGELLNAVVALRGAGKQILFVEPNHLVLALMMLMGIVDLADVRRRRV